MRKALGFVLLVSALGLPLAVAYPTGTGRTRTLTVKTENSSYREGAPVDVLYTGEDARVRGLNTTFGTPMIFTVAGLAWSAFAAFILAVALRK